MVNKQLFKKKNVYSSSSSALVINSLHIHFIKHNYSQMYNIVVVVNF